MEEKKLLEIIENFAYEGKVESVTPLGEGLINDTYLVHTAGVFAPDYVLQRINHVVFPDVEMLMRNIAAVTAHIRHKLEQQGVQDINRRCLNFIRLRNDSQRNYIEAEGQYWRLMVFIEDSVTKQAVDAETSRAAGKAFGQFEAMLAEHTVFQTLLLTIKPIMNQYETVFILTPVLSDVQMKEAVDKFRDLLTAAGSEIINEENWGLRKLAYPIEKKTTGFYQLIEYKAEPDVIAKFELQMRRDERVLRYLTVKQEKYAIEYAEKRRNLKKQKEE